MDKYFIFFDETILSALFHTLIIVGTQVILSLLLKERYRWVGITVFILYFVIVFSIGVYIRNNDDNLFFKSNVKSTVADRVEWRNGSYRCKLESGIVLLWDLEIGDSIVKEANTDSFYVYRKDPQIGVYQLVSRSKN